MTGLAVGVLPAQIIAALSRTGGADLKVETSADLVDILDRCVAMVCSLG